MHIQLRRTFLELLIHEPADDSQTLYPGSATLHLPALLDELLLIILSEGARARPHSSRACPVSRWSRVRPPSLRLEHVAHDFDSAFVERGFLDKKMPLLLGQRHDAGQISDLIQTELSGVRIGRRLCQMVARWKAQPARINRSSPKCGATN